MWSTTHVYLIGNQACPVCQWLDAPTCAGQSQCMFLSAISRTANKGKMSTDLFGDQSISQSFTTVTSLHDLMTVQT